MPPRHLLNTWIELWKGAAIRPQQLADGSQTTNPELTLVRVLAAWRRAQHSQFAGPP